MYTFAEQHENDPCIPPAGVAPNRMKRTVSSQQDIIA